MRTVSLNVEQVNMTIKLQTSISLAYTNYATLMKKSLIAVTKFTFLRNKKIKATFYVNGFNKQQILL